MQPYFSQYLDNLTEYHNEIRAAMRGLPPEALNRAPLADANSIAVLVTHLAGAERYWLGDVAAGVPSGRDRSAEFRAQGLTEADLLARLAAIEGDLPRFLEPLTLAQLEEPRLSPRNERQVTLGWALCHALKHTALHLGHIQITRQLLEPALK